ncbi:dTDP-4-dehydrorhamnose reductase [Massilia sp. RP-1-19]|uniref:dTDP-4-dehydrorhamnose reductase n=1 Tax=Massilia polaris TaxID=2728846 RepID=A0A848HP81_9BURK|nr:dTDP-4-dehydrorhamnose reductase [Massilia polaris]NML61063.1 dTDP-4-dehydrorhamnose reductase [Massilia polaris]
MKILLTGAGGQVGYELERSLQGLGQVTAVGRARIDLSDLDQVRDVIRSVRPGLIVNAAAYTAVDKAESEPALARRINAEAPEVMALEARKLGAAMVHYSTDYVFDGRKAGAYVETDVPNPINVYGQTKLEGEQAVAAAGIDHLILRTSWVYGMHGKNFLLTMLRLAQQRDALRIVCDQHGAPTWSRTVADATAVLLARAQEGGDSWWKQHGGLYHLGSGGQTTWCGFTEAIIEQRQLACHVVPITSADYPLPARRPENSVLDCARLQALCSLPHWRDALALCLK